MSICVYTYIYIYTHVNNTNNDNETTHTNNKSPPSEGSKWGLSSGGTTCLTTCLTLDVGDAETTHDIRR